MTEVPTGVPSRLSDLPVLPAAGHPELLGPPVAAALAGWEHAESVGVVEIDPEVSDTAAMMERYQLPMTVSANCVVVAGRREGVERAAACVVRADTRADVNRTVKKLLDVRKASFMPTDQAVGESGMEFGAITPLGLPPQWRLLVDERVVAMDVAVLGAGLRSSKLVVPGALVGRMPGAEVVPGLAG